MFCLRNGLPKRGGSIKAVRIYSIYDGESHGQDLELITHLCASFRIRAADGQAGGAWHSVLACGTWDCPVDFHSAPGR